MNFTHLVGIFLLGTYLRVYRALWVVDNGRNIYGVGLVPLIQNSLWSCSIMGGALSHFFQSGHALLSSSHNRNVSEQTRRNIRIIFDALCANPKVGAQRLDGLLSSIPRSENILQIHNEDGYNLLQICVGLNNLELIRWCLSRNIDINRGACSLPLHIACLKGFEDVVELLLKHGARVDVEARMCWPGHHQHNCEERGRHSRSRMNQSYASSDKLQCAIYYAIDGDQVINRKILK